MAKMISAADYARQHGLSPRTVQQKCARGNVPGAFRIGTGNRATWVVPEDAPYEDARVKSGKYIGFRDNLKKNKIPKSEETTEE